MLWNRYNEDEDDVATLSLCRLLCIVGRKSVGGRHRLGIMVYAASESTKLNGDSLTASPDRDAASVGNNSTTPLAVLQLTGSRSRRRLSSWQRLLLPTTYVQDALDSGDGVVRLRIVCVGCDAFGRCLVVGRESTPTSRPSISGPDPRGTPYLELVGRRSRRRRRRHHRLCPATADKTDVSKLATIMRRRC